MAQGDGALGRVVWSVIETVSNKVIHSGTLDVGEEDVTVEEHRTAENQIYYRKSIKLAGPFAFALDEHPDKSPEDLKGFAMMGLNSEVQTYSWEWFNVTSPSEATKLQEEGKIGIEVGNAPCGWEVSKTDFQTDVSLRLTRFFGDPTQEPFWRVVVHQGSSVVWPAGA